MSTKTDLDNHADQLNPNNDAYWQSRGYDERPDWDLHSSRVEEVYDVDDSSYDYDDAIQSQMARIEKTIKVEFTKMFSNNPAFFFHDSGALILPNIKRVCTPSEIENFNKGIHFYVLVDAVEFRFNIESKKPDTYQDYLKGRLQEKPSKIQEQVEEVEKQEAVRKSNRVDSWFAYQESYESTRLKQEFQDLQKKVEACKQFENDYQSAKKKAEEFYANLLTALDKFWTIKLSLVENCAHHSTSIPT